VLIGILKIVLSDIVKVAEWICWLFHWDDFCGFRAMKITIPS
jgi:hypothetical protein